RAIEFTRGRPNRVPHYRELVRLTRATLAYLDQASTKLATVADPRVVPWQAERYHYRPLIERIIWQTERRVVFGEAVAAGDKIVSLFEPHADIIVKGSRDVEYGHKLNLITGRSGLILDVVIETGNPADSERFLPMLERHIAFYGEAPRQAAADGGYASRLNLSQAKALGVHDMAFHKKAGLRIKDMVKSNWVYRKLRNFRAGIESGISCLKRAFGLARARPLEGLRLVLSRRLQPGPLCPAQADLTLAFRQAARQTGKARIEPSFELSGFRSQTNPRNRQTNRKAGQHAPFITQFSGNPAKKTYVYGPTLV